MIPNKIMNKLPNILEERLEPIIIVHPYWLLKMYNLKFDEYDNTQKNIFMQENKLGGTSFGQDYYSYIQNIKRTITNYPGQLITLETRRSSDLTKERYNHLNRKDKSYLIETPDMTPMPRKEGWVELFDLLDSINAKRVLLAGGSYSRHLKDFKNPGCLGLTEEILSYHNYEPTIIEGLNYTLDWKWEGDKVKLIQN